jgi:VIT1/CCC1 family predicted Fe2+/Mn2+ transporter
VADSRYVAATGLQISVHPLVLTYIAVSAQGAVMESRPRPNTKRHRESHRGDRAGWLRAAVLGANDGIVSVAGVVVGVAASGSDAHAVLTAGIAATVAGAMSMAAGEYVSVQSQADTERADLAIERRELHEDPHTELEELTGIYRKRGLDPALARQVAEQLTAHDALAAHARDELGMSETLRARPLQAASASATAFCCGAALPMAAALLAPPAIVSSTTTITTLVGLLITGAWAATMGGASPWRGALRVTFWGAAAMIAASQIGRLFNTAV